MIRIEADAWSKMVAHAQSTYPNECCGAMLGATEDETKMVRVAMPLENAFEGAQAAR
jgi:proteasome lid subunit RPN8/RPN11